MPSLGGVDILLLNGWISSNGLYNDSPDGMKSVIQRLRPSVMLPGHAQELAHNMTGAGNRLTFEMPLRVQDEVTIPTRTVVLTWGERLDWVR